MACFSVRAKRHSWLKEILSRPFSRVAHAVRNRQTKANTDSLIRVQLTRLYYTKVIQKRLKNEGRTYKIKGYIVIISYICRDERFVHLQKRKIKLWQQRKDRVLWADDEIDLLKPHILFLQDKGYEVIPVISGQDAIECCKEESFDIIFLDENMPGLTGLETLAQIKAINPDVPVVMVTKSEEEAS